MQVLLDTHLVIWWQKNDPKLPKELIQMIQTQATQVFVSHASLWEIAIKKSLGKIDIDLPLLIEFIKKTGFNFLEIDTAAILNVTDLPKFAEHKDPFDRMLVAQALANQLTLVTVDEKLSWYQQNILVF